MIEQPDISKQNSIYEKIKEASEFILDTEGKRTSDNTLSNSDLFEKARNLFVEEFAGSSKNTFNQYLSNLVRDTNSAVNCLGKKRILSFRYCTTDSQRGA